MPLICSMWELVPACGVRLRRPLAAPACGLPAIAQCQAPPMLAVPALSRASPLPQDGVRLADLQVITPAGMPLATSLLSADGPELRTIAGAVGQ